jgi:hypothetical protein
MHATQVTGTVSTPGFDLSDLFSGRDARRSLIQAAATPYQDLQPVSGLFLS